MAWEQIQKVQGRFAYNAEWATHPCVSVTRHGLGLNEQFLSVFAQKKREAIILIDKQNKLIGIKFPTGEDVNGAYRLNETSAHKKGGRVSKSISCKRIPKAFPEFVGNCYRAVLNSEQRMIVVTLTSENKVGEGADAEDQSDATADSSTSSQKENRSDAT